MFKHAERVLSVICFLPLACAHTPAKVADEPRLTAPLADNSPQARAGTQEFAPTAPDAQPSAGYSRRLDFRRGDPVVPVRLMEGREEIALSAPGRIRMRAAGAVPKVVEGAPGSVWKVRLSNAEPAVASVRIVLGEFRFSDKAGLAAEQQAWIDRGVTVQVRTIGAVYGIRGQVIDNRRYFILWGEPVDRSGLSERQADIQRQFGVRTSTLEDVEREPSGSLELVDEAGNVVAVSKDRLTAEPLEPSGIAVQQVEFGIGYDSHGFEDRSYRGSLEIAIDRRGKLAVVNLVSLEDLLRGLVPAEMFARAPMEALKAQAVTARGEVLAKVGTKHLGDPYLLCSEQHCAVYKGLSAEAESSSAAVEATRGEALFSADHRLVDSVYSAVCGGHTENNDAVWGGPANSNLRGRPDILGTRTTLPSPNNLDAFLAADAPAACRVATLAQPGKYRWERRFTASEVDRLTSGLKVGPVRAITVLDRGVSGRARSIEIAGDAGTARVDGELSIRRLFGMLNSAMFVVDAERSNGNVSAWIFRGGGWGHGVGMCQLGAIGRAEAGQDYRAILQHYFSGAEVIRLY